MLLSPKKEFLKFGYEAEERYYELAADDDVDHFQYYFFRRFKMILHSRAVNSSLMKLFVVKTMCKINLIEK